MYLSLICASQSVWHNDIKLGRPAGVEGKGGIIIIWHSPKFNSPLTFWKLTFEISETQMSGGPFHFLCWPENEENIIKHENFLVRTTVSCLQKALQKVAL